MAEDILRPPEETPIEKQERTKEEDAAKGRKKKGKKVFINEDLFGSSKTLDDSPSEEGISHLKIKPQELGNIPGLIDHWKAELDMRVKEILTWKSNSFFQKASSLIKGDRIPPTISGEELSHFHPTKAALEKVKILKRDPTDMMARLELVSIVAKSGRDFPVEMYRTFLIQSTVACSLGEFTNVGLQMAIWAQDMYFTKLFYKCKGESMALEDKIRTQEGKENAFTRQAQGLRTHISDVRRNMEIIKNYQKQSEKALRDNKAVYNTTLSIDEITTYLLESGGKLSAKEEEERDEKKMKIFKKSSEILLLLRVLPLLKPEAEKITNQLKKMDPDAPIVHFLQAKVNMSDLVFKVGQFQGGDRSSEMRNEVQEAFKKTHNCYGLAVKKVGKFPKTKLEYSVFIEYAHLIHYFYKVAKTTLGIRLPREWLEAIFKKTVKLLELAQEKGKVDAIMSDIMKDMVDEGFVQEGVWQMKNKDGLWKEAYAGNR
ncbi:MAG: hypothetical protein HQM14_04795 [SAR324 cluster bacterium]|nr:hypothetical protein [SAR324 cluster bacterium]